MRKDRLRQFITETLADYADEQTMAGVDDSQGWAASVRYHSKNPTSSKKRREVKQLWNKYADHAFFDDPKQLTVIHTLGKYGMDAGLDRYFDISKLRRIPGIDIPAKDELSCSAFMTAFPKSARYGLGGFKQPYFTFKRKRVTFASFLDIASEWLSLATDEDKEFYKNSGLPKRPSSFVSLSNFPLGRDDIQQKHRQPKVLQEVIIDNWIVDTFFGHEKHREEAEKLGLKFEAL